jgi:RNA polymerase sigma-B factor
MALLSEMDRATIDIERQAARDAAIRHYLGFATGLARRFRYRGVPAEDLDQIAAVALVGAVDRFDVNRGSSFTAFLAPTVLGEIKRYFRDHTWAVRAPRALQERCLAITKATDRLTQELGRSPTVADLSRDLNLSEEEILEGMECGWSAYSASLLSSPVPDEEYGTDPSAGPDPGIEMAENWQSLRPLLQDLPDRDRRILRMRFVDDMTQTSIAEQIGVSQMHVSRLLATCLQRLRSGLLAET